MRHSGNPVETCASAVRRRSVISSNPANRGATRNRIRERLRVARSVCSFICACVFLFGIGKLSASGASGADTRILLRMDDSGYGRHVSQVDPGVLSDPEITERVVRIVAKHGAKLSIGVIPNVVSGSPAYDPRDPQYMRLSACPEEMRVLKQAMETGCVEIAQHGWTHQKIDGQGTEFVGLPLEAQRDMIERGRDEIETALNTNVDVFIPPFNSHDQNTLLALRDLGFAAISSEARSSNVVDGIHYVPCTTSLQELDVAMKARRQHAGAAIVVALFHGHDKVVCAGQCGGFFNILIRGFQPTVADVLADGAGEQVWRLQHHPDARLDGMQ